MPREQLLDCYIDELSRFVGPREDPRPAVREITEAARDEGGLLLESCHGIMHAVGRAYASAQRVQLADLQDVLPRANDAGCPAGFAHGVISVLPVNEDAATVCDASATRYQRYSCVHGFGHGFMRMEGGDLPSALRSCHKLGTASAADCAQGAFHDYWFATMGVDDAPLAGRPIRDPRKLCASLSDEFVRPCWYRAFLETRPKDFALERAEDVEGLCSGLRGMQRSACITGASVIGPPDPRAQLRLCAGLRSAADAAACARGVKVANVPDAEMSEYVEIASGCADLPRGARAPCFGWMGTALTVVTDGAFAGEGCQGLAGNSARRACVAGANRSEGALETFS
jgi:hypothetical protein